MPVTRRSGKAPSVPTPKSAPKAKGKRGANAGCLPALKRSKKAKDEKEQTTIEETMDVNSHIAKNGTSEGGDKNEEKGDLENRNATKNNQNGKKKDEDVNVQDEVKDGEKNAFDEVRADETDVKDFAKKEEAQKTEEISNNKDSVIEDTEREAAMPSSILEKGIIYFFFRGRVNVDEPQSVDDIARSYIVLRPLPIGAKLGEGPLEDAKNARLIAFPKKVLPKNKRDRFLAFVEKPKTSVKDLKDNFVAGSDYSTKTVGTRHTPAATPVAEGVYAITSTGRESHLAYYITAPEILGEVQKDIGINKRGSYVVSVKNPTFPAPSNVSLPKGAEYPENVMEKFRGLRWMPLEPELLNFENTQFLLIGETMGGLGKAMEEQKEDAKDESKEAPAEEMEKLEDEDQIRVKHLKVDDPIFADLGLSSKEYPKMQTTW